MAPQLSFIVASAGTFLVSVFMISLLVITLHIVFIVTSFVGFCIR
jgi:hypothetical protein